MFLVWWYPSYAAGFEAGEAFDLFIPSCEAAFEQDRGGGDGMLKGRISRAVSRVRGGVGEGMEVARLVVYCVSLPLNIYMRGTWVLCLMHYRKKVSCTRRYCRTRKMVEISKQNEMQPTHKMNVEGYTSTLDGGISTSLHTARVLISGHHTITKGYYRDY